ARTGARPGASPEAAARTAPQRGPGCRRTRALPPRSLRASGAGRARTEGRSRARARRGAGNAEATRGARRRAVRACSCWGACRTWLRRLRDCVQTRTGRNRPDSIERALAALEPECDRAVRLAAHRGATAKTARWLAARGFAQESVESALAGIAENEGRELG